MAETLANLTLRETFRPKTTMQYITDRPMADIRAAITGARRFVLDDRMSAFLADLSSVPFQVQQVRRPQVLDTIRHGARLPHATTWIEFNGSEFRRRLLEVAESKTDSWGHALVPGSEVPARWGWLLEQHPKLETVVQLTEFIDMGDDSVGAAPFTVVWQTIDQPLPYNDADPNGGTFMHGITGYVSPYIATRPMQKVPAHRLVDVVKEEDGRRIPQFKVDKMIVEMGGLARYAMSLLATINDIPVLHTFEAQHRGFVARGAHRKFLDHTVIRLNVPQTRNTRLLAQKLIAIARKRAHEVRGHWRLYQRGEGAVCTPGQHQWMAEDERGHCACMNCSSWRTWIHPHQRGDASLGYVTHEYEVTHG